jgi:hypothetical protein
MEYNFYRADDDLINYEQLKDMKRNKRGRNRNKEKAEFQFNAFAAPIKLETFFKDIMDCEPNLPDDTIELTGLEECAPMIPEPNVYPTNSDELSLEILDIATDVLDSVDVNDMHQKIESRKTKDQRKREAAQKRMELILSDCNQSSITIRDEGIHLTAKRLSLKALQLFSFNDNFDKHFTMDKQQLRDLNVDMVVDQSFESVLWLRRLGLAYQQHYVNSATVKYPFISTASDYDLMNLPPECTHHRVLAYSTALKLINHSTLLNLFDPIGNHLGFDFDVDIDPISTKTILDFFGIKVFGHDPLLNNQLNYLHLIPYYLRKPEKNKIFQIFESLDPSVEKPFRSDDLTSIDDLCDLFANFNRSAESISFD